MKQLLLLLALAIVPLLPTFAQGSWSQKISFPSSPRADASTFAVGSKVYMVAGQTSNLARTSQVWEYDALNDTWTQKAPLPGPPRSNAIALNIAGIGYCGLGYSPAYNDWYAYNPATNTWTAKASVRRMPRQGQSAGPRPPLACCI